MNIVITSGAYSLISDITVNDIMLLKKYKSDALCIKNGEGATKFAIGYSEGNPCVTSFGITFGSRSLVDDKASVTEMLPQNLDTADKAKGYVAERFGGVVPYLEELERSVPEMARVVREKNQALIDSITIA